MKAPNSLDIRFSPSIVLNIKYTINESLNFSENDPQKFGDSF